MDNNNQNQWGVLWRGLAADPVAKHYHKMKSCLWLYIYLVVSVNRDTGKLFCQPSTIAQDMGVKEETVRSWLGHLRRQNYVWARRQGDWLLIGICRWKPLPPMAPRRLRKGIPVGYTFYGHWGHTTS